MEEYLNWSEANEMCGLLDPDGVSTLTSIHSQEENEYIWSFFPHYGWLGGTDKAEEGVWRCVNFNTRVLKV